MPTRRQLLGYFAGATALTFGVRAAVQGLKPPPNVLFLSIDDLNDWLGTLGGHPQTRTPNLDRLAARSTLFRRAYCAAPACNPSRIATLTGIAPWESGAYANRSEWRTVLPDAVTLPQLFKANGYWVGGAGKIFHDRFSDCTGWDAYFPYQRFQNEQELSTAWTPAPQPSQRPVNGISNIGSLDWGDLPTRDRDLPDTRIADWTIAQLQAPNRAPFFLACGFYKPHLPWYVPAPYFDALPLDTLVLPELLPTDADDIPAAGQALMFREWHERIVNAGQYPQAVQAYLAAIAYVDTQMGRVLDALDASPYAQNTVVMLWSDHGFHLGEKFHWLKFALWERATRVPLMIATPGSSGQVCDRVVSLLDLYPTLAQLARFDPLPAVSGRSLIPLLRDPTQGWEEFAVTTWEGHYSVRSADYRYIRYQDGSEELYDHRRDPQEWENLANQADLGAIKAELAAQLPTNPAPPAPVENQRTYGCTEANYRDPLQP